MAARVCNPSVRAAFGAVAIFMLNASAFAQEIPEHYQPAGPLGSGGAGVASTMDDDAVWSNPAGIARVRKARSKSGARTKIPNLLLGANSQSRTFYGNLQAAGGSNVEDVAANSEGLGSKPFWVRAAMFPVTMFSITPKSPAAFGIYMNSTTSAFISEEAPDDAAVTAISDIGGVITLGQTNMSNRLSTAIQIRPVYRYALENTIPSNDLSDRTAVQRHFTQLANKTSAVAIDAGALFTIADFWFPTFGLSILNAPLGCKSDYLNPFTEKRESVCGTKFTGDFGSPDAMSIVDPTDIRAGFSITPRFGRDIAARISVDAHHIVLTAGNKNYGLQGIEPGKLLHAGVEIFSGSPLTPPDFSLRLGTNQGFFTYGIEGRFRFLALSLTSYGQDISARTSRREDRRYLLGASAEF
ncbi:MAG: hypothetical protein RIQ81_586 [Pseudomonadota bacterium]|jgi:hypothetical protein